MSSLLDAILGSFNSGQSGGFIPGSLLRDAPSSGYLPDDQVSTPPADPYGNRVGGPAPGVPLPRPRPPDAGPAALTQPATADAAPLDPPPGESSGSEGGLAAGPGLNPDSMRRISAGLAGGLSNVQNSPFAGQVAANAAGGAFAAGNKSDETAINQALKLRQIEQRGRYRADTADAKIGQLHINQQKADQQGAGKNGYRAIGLQNAETSAAIPRSEALVIDEETRKAAQADRDGTLAQARAAVGRDPSKRAAIIARLRQLGITF